MREILFRGKRLSGDGWAYGDLSYHASGGKVYIFPGDGHDSPYCYEVDFATVGQYTGLTDKKMKKIFDGDILEWDEREWGAPHFEAVTWDYDLFAMRAKDWSEFCVVCGNEYDTPELWKEARNAPTN